MSLDMFESAATGKASSAPASDNTFTVAKPKRKKGLLIGAMVAVSLAIIGGLVTTSGDEKPVPQTTPSAATPGAPVVTTPQAAATPSTLPGAAVPAGASPEQAAATPDIKIQILQQLDRNHALLAKRQQEQDALQSRLDATAMKTCETINRRKLGMAVTGVSYTKCLEVGPAVYYACAPSGIYWDVALPGCEIK